MLLSSIFSTKAEHQEEISKVSNSTELICSTCMVRLSASLLTMLTMFTIPQVSAPSPEELWNACVAKQRLNIYGAHRQFSCEVCDVHLSEQEWLDNHKMGLLSVWWSCVILS